MPAPPFPALATWLRRAPVVLPHTVDRVSEWWWRQSSRTRVAAPVALLVAATLLVNPFARDNDHVEVLVAVRQLSAGVTISETDVARQSRPRRYVPTAPLTDADGVASQMIPEGSVLVQAHVGPSGASANLTAGHVAVAFPREMLPPVGPGDTVTLVDVQFDGQARTVAHAVHVFYDDDNVLWLAVREADSVNVAAAAHHGRVTTIVHPR